MGGVSRGIKGVVGGGFRKVGVASGIPPGVHGGGGTIGMVGVCPTAAVTDIEAIWVLIGVNPGGGSGAGTGSSASRLAFSLARASSGGVGARCPLSLSLSSAWMSGLVSSSGGGLQRDVSLRFVDTNGSPSSMSDPILSLLSR